MTTKRQLYDHQRVLETIRLEQAALSVPSEPPANGAVQGRATAYGIPNGRPGRVWEIDKDGFPEFIRFEGSIFERGVFEDAVSALSNGTNRVRFLFMHGDADQGWVPNVPMGVNSLPIGTVTGLEEQDDGLYFTADFASHELAQAVRELVGDGGLTELSIGWITNEFDLRTDETGHVYRYITMGELLDVSVVVWGQYGLNATITELYNEALTPACRDELGLCEPEPNYGTMFLTPKAANNSTINAAITSLRDAASSLSESADVLADVLEIMLASNGGDEGSDDSDDDSQLSNIYDATARLDSRLRQVHERKD